MDKQQKKAVWLFVEMLVAVAPATLLYLIGLASYVTAIFSGSIERVAAVVRSPETLILLAGGYGLWSLWTLWAVITNRAAMKMFGRLFIGAGLFCGVVVSGYAALYLSPNLQWTDLLFLTPVTVLLHLLWISTANRKT